ncbi:glycosyltransferase family 1 protein [Calocera cornea HHB12733]|uniref:Glycosyltransferase family 1 protein n=1 Tax=Calocera cornea HHB12733 TaxID=1353952 RepID=A0A165F5H2_9BASI|nr:glycosyltransferase family 1 protein [Calocera cornea HHB12733]
MVRHAILIPFFAWGHLRPSCALAVTLVRRYTDLVISFLCEVDFVKRAKDEMSRQCASDQERIALLSRMRVIAYGYPQPPLSPEMAAMVMQMDPRNLHVPTIETCTDALEVVDKLMEGRSFLDKLGGEWNPVGALPRLVVSDVMMGNVLLPVKEKYDLALFIWWIGNTASFTRMFAPLKHGGRAEGYAAECEAIFADGERRAGRSFGDIARDLWIRDPRVAGDVIKLAGLPAYYQWEDFPQEFWFPTVYASLALGAKVVDAADGFLMTTVEELESEAHRDMIQWARPRRVLCLGPQLPPALLSEDASQAAEALAKLDVNYHFPAASGPAHGHSNGPASGTAVNGQANGGGRACPDPAAPDPAIAFLDKALAVHGPHSALYISFGSVFFPPAAHAQILLESLLALDQPMPFVITVSAGRLPEELTAALVASGRGVVVQWAPQQAVLSHAALGWMLTHCGGGGTFEALSSGVPVIGWPFMGDQPQHALWLSRVLGTAYELLQVRTGAPGRPALRPDTHSDGAAGGRGVERERETVIAGTEQAVRGELARVLRAAGVVACWQLLVGCCLLSPVVVGHGD